MYAPLNCQAVWIESEQGTFIKTIGRWCTTTTQGIGESEHLVAWRNKSGLGDIDAVTGATRQNHGGSLVATWDLKDKLGADVPDGVYRIRFENADSNSTTQGQNAQSTFTFTKGPTPDIRPGVTDPAATPIATSPTVSIDYNPRALECDNMIVDPGETCDPITSCPSACAQNSGDVCKPNVLMGASSACTAVCMIVPITTCVNADGCCADGCTEDNDSDCDLSGNFGCAAGTESGGTGVLLFGVMMGAVAIGSRRRRR